MSLSDKIFSLSNLPNDLFIEPFTSTGAKFLHPQDVREAVKELKKKIIIHANMWSYMEENQRDIQIKNEFKQVFGEKLV